MSSGARTHANGWPNMIDLKNILIALVVGLVVGGLSAWWLTSNYETAKWTKAIDKQKIEAAAELQKLTESVLAAERAIGTVRSQLEKNDAMVQQTINQNANINRTLVAKLGGLRDPGHRPDSDCSKSQGPGAAGTATNAAAGGRLSDAASQFLLEFAARADRAAQYARTCSQWEGEVRNYINNLP